MRHGCNCSKIAHTSFSGLRNCIQHQLGEIDDLIASGGQIWGYVSWAEVIAGRHTGKWLMISPGASYKGDRWLFIGPANLPFPVPEGRIRLNAFGRQVYLDRAIEAVREAVGELVLELENGSVLPRNTPAVDRQGSDLVLSGGIEVLIGRGPASQDSASSNEM